MMPTQLKIAVWNANGLVAHAQELKAFITNQKLDIVLISEAHMTDRSFIKIPKYTIYHTQHPGGTARGGTAVIVNNKIKHYETAKYSQRNIQATTVEIEDSHGKLRLAAVYCPPNLSIKKEQFESFFETLGHRFVAGGDYNAKHHHWGSRLVTPRGRHLYQAMINNNLQQLSSGQPTYWPTDRNKTPDVIDFCVIKNISRNYLDIEHCLDLSSDHTPLLVTLQSQVKNKSPPPTLTSVRTNWNAFRDIVASRMKVSLPLKTEGEVDEAVEFLIRSIQQAAWSATPTTTTFEKPGYCPEHIQRKIEEKRRLRQRWQTTHCPQDKTNYNRATAQLKRLLNDYKNQGISRYLESLSPRAATNHSLWKVTKKIKHPQNIQPPIRTQDGSWARTDEEKSCTFAKHLSEVFKPYPREIPPEEEEFIHQALDVPFQMDPPIRPVKISEIKSIIKGLKPKKAPGYDLITGKILKELPQEGLKFITTIFNAILRLHYFPSQWKVAQIILIHKAGKDPTNVASYRPISLLPVLSKVFEKILLNRIQPSLEEKKLIPNHQFGFRARHSTIEQVHRVGNKIREALEKKWYCSAAFIDISQAFDKVWHMGLLHKIKAKLSHHYYQLLKSYLTDRWFLVRVGEAYSSLLPIKSGVPQGSVLGPLLYLLYTADLPSNTTNVEIATFADDTAIMASHQDPTLASSHLQGHLSRVERWLKVWRVKANSTKSTHVTFTLRKQTCPEVFLNNIKIPQKEDVKYLGLHLDRRLTWAKHIWNKRLQLGHTYRSMYWMMGANSHLNMENKLLLYKAILKPVWLYGIELWGTASDSNILRLQRFQSKTLRAVCGAPWYVPNHLIHRDLGMTTVKEEISARSKKYQDRLTIHPNPLATDLLSIPDVRRLKRLNTLDLPDRT